MELATLMVARINAKQDRVEQIMDKLEHIGDAIADLEGLEEYADFVLLLQNDERQLELEERELRGEICGMVEALHINGYTVYQRMFSDRHYVLVDGNGEE
jgi:hypothetical protein